MKRGLHGTSVQQKPQREKRQFWLLSQDLTEYVVEAQKMTENFKDEFEDENIICGINKANRIQEDTMKWSFRKD